LDSTQQETIESNQGNVMPEGYRPWTSMQSLWDAYPGGWRHRLIRGMHAPTDLRPIAFGPRYNFVLTRPTGGYVTFGEHPWTDIEEYHLAVSRTHLPMKNFLARMAKGKMKMVDAPSGNGECDADAVKADTAFAADWETLRKGLTAFAGRVVSHEWKEAARRMGIVRRCA
jgi:hypothetical protein